MTRIDKIVLSTELRRGTNDTYDVVELWIAGIPFRADLMGDIMERQINRIATEAGIDLHDRRAAQAHERQGHDD